MLQNLINVKVKLLLIVKEHCFIFQIYSANEVLKIYSLSPQECMTMEKNNYLFNLREEKLLEQFRQCLSNNKKNVSWITIHSLNLQKPIIYH